MSRTKALYHRTKETNIYPLGGDRFLIEAFLRDEVHDVHAEIEILHPSLEIVEARSEVRNGPFTKVCNSSHGNIEALVGMKVQRGFTVEARQIVGGVSGCHRVSELVVEIAQAAYQLHFVRYFASIPAEVRSREDVPLERFDGVVSSIPGMSGTCLTYSDKGRQLVAEKAEPLILRRQDMPERDI